MAHQIVPIVPVDFTALVTQIAKNGGFNDFAIPLGPTDILIAGKYSYPTYPGQDSYGNGPALLKVSNHDLPQDLIGAQRASAISAINMYMPLETYTQWMHEFFSTEFLASPLFRKIIKKFDFPGTRYDAQLSNVLSMKLEAPERKRTDRRLYTNDEIAITRQVCEKIPAIALTVLAYQASFVEYLDCLHTAIADSPALSELQRQRGLEVVNLLMYDWKNENFMENILPGIAINYYTNNDRKIGPAPTEQDFSEGMCFAYKNGMFINQIKRPAGDIRQFSCPAKVIIARSSSLDLAEKIPEEEKEHAALKSKGTVLHHIFVAIEKQLETPSQAVTETIRDIESWINAAGKKNR